MGATCDRGQSAVVVMVVVMVLGVALATALADVGTGVHDRIRAQSAADAAALGSLDAHGALGGGRTAAARLAERHGAVLVSWRRGPGRDEVTVVVRVGRATATARATDAP